MTYRMFEKLCFEAGVKPADVSRETGIAKATFSAWKNGKLNLSKDKQELVATYFGKSLSVIDAAENGQSKLDLSERDAQRLMMSAQMHREAADAIQRVMNSMLVSEGKQLYYLDPETAETAQDLFENKEMKMLFDAAKGSKAEDLKMAADLLMRLKKQEENG